MGRTSMTGDAEAPVPLTVPLVVLASGFIATAVAFLGAGVVGGTPVAEAAGGWLGQDATPLAPATPALAIAVEKTANLAVKPDVSGRPAKAMSRKANAPATSGERLPSPVHCVSVVASAPVSRVRTSMMMPNAASTENP